MEQSLYALLALALIGGVSLRHHQSEAHDQTRTIRAEIEAGAQTAAGEVHEALSVLPFDAIATTDTTALTPEALFGSLPDSGLSDATDLDDAHGVSDSIRRTLTDPTTGDPLPISYAITVSVRYVRASGGTLAATGGARTLTKRVAVTVRHGSLLAPVEVRRTYSL